MTSRDCVWKEFCQKLMKTMLQEKGSTHCIIAIWYTNLFPCLKSENFGVESDESQEQIRIDRRSKGAKVHFASLMDICQHKNAKLVKKKNQKSKDRVVLRGDIVKDDSGS